MLLIILLSNGLVYSYSCASLLLSASIYLKTILLQVDQGYVYITHTHTQTLCYLGNFKTTTQQQQK